jgi:peptide/nickel transport system permease protein
VLAVVFGLLDFARRKPLGALGGLVLSVLVVVAVFAPQISPHDPIRFDYDHVLTPPGPAFPFGTDNFGRDVLSRVMWGSRTSMYVGVLAVLLGQGGGGLWGVYSAYAGGVVDMVSQRLVDVLMIFPSLVLALTIMSVAGPSLNNVLLAIALSQSPHAIRTMRSAALSVQQSLHVEAARAVGCTNARVVLNHILPNCMAPLLIVATASLGSAILTEASLSFLGLGVPPPSPSWGGMMSGDGRAFMTQAPWMVLFPGIVISLAVFGCNLLGDAVRDVWDPRLRGTS